MQLGSEPWIPDKQILEICHCRLETILLTPNSSCEACLDFTHVTARWIAQPPKAAFVTRLRLGQLPNRSARQLPDQSTTLLGRLSSTGNTRRRGAPLGAHIFRRQQADLVSLAGQTPGPDGARRSTPPSPQRNAPPHPTSQNNRPQASKPARLQEFLPRSIPTTPMSIGPFLSLSNQSRS